MHEVPPDYFDQDMYQAKREQEDPDVRVPEHEQDGIVLPENEYFEDERDIENYKK